MRVLQGNVREEVYSLGPPRGQLTDLVDDSKRGKHCKPDHQPWAKDADQFTLGASSKFKTEMTYCPVEQTDDLVPHFLDAQTYNSPAVFYKNNSIGIHRIRNPAQPSGNADEDNRNRCVTLHLYSPPIPKDIAWLDPDGKHWLPENSAEEPKMEMDSQPSKAAPGGMDRCLAVKSGMTYHSYNGCRVPMHVYNVEDSMLDADPAHRLASVNEVEAVKARFNFDHLDAGIA